MNEDMHTTESAGHERQQQKPDDMRQAILASIHSGAVHRKPRWRFVVQAVFVIVGCVFALLAAIYLVSAIVFALRATGAGYLPTLGFAGIPGFLRSLPWVLLVLSIAFIVLLYFLVKRYSFAYGRPFLYSALAIIVVVSASSILIGFTSFHKGLYQRARDGQLPFGTIGLFGSFGQEPHDATIGIITDISGSNWTIMTPEGHTYRVSIRNGAPYPQNASVGDEVVVLGEREDRTIDAVGIEPVQHGSMPFDGQGYPQVRQQPMIPAPNQNPAQAPGQ